MSDMEKDPKAKEVFDQEISADDLNAVAGGAEADSNNCVVNHSRDIYAGGFPNCAATVEDGSHCGDNDACYSDAVVYTNMSDCTFGSLLRCKKAWK